MKQKLNIYIGKPALVELGRIANVRGLSKSKVVEELVLGAETDVTGQDVADCMSAAMEKLGAVKRAMNEERTILPE